MMMIDYYGDPRAVLCHFNKNHDPNTGKFTSGDANIIGNNLLSQMKTFKYKSYTGLKDARGVDQDGGGDCHSQVMYELEKLREKNVDAKAKFLIEVDPKTMQGGSTHSFVYYIDEKGNVNWIENAWRSQSGIHSYPSVEQMVTDVERKFRDEQPDKAYSEIVWGEFEPKDHKVGESLQELVDICLSYPDNEN